jgi:SAM-dependent methyltransferase
MQPATVTSANRHPELFDRVVDLLADHPRPAILSFGCSTGEEVITLARRFPTATLRGIDINPACIRTARQRLANTPDPRIDFVCASSAEGELPDRYDAIFALSVLRHGRLDAERPDDCSAILPFDRFARAVAALDGCLKPGGLLVIWGSHFRFADLPLAAGYSTLHSQPLRPAMPLYGADNGRIAQPGSEAVIMRKRLNRCVDPPARAKAWSGET